LHEKYRLFIWAQVKIGGPWFANSLELRYLTAMPLPRTATSILVAFCLSSAGYANLSWNSSDGFRWADLPISAHGQTGFTRLDAGQTGIHFTNELEEWAAAANRVLESGSGVAAGDYDQDGWVDLFFCSIQGGCKLFRNLGGWKFEETTTRASLLFSRKHYRGAVFADIDGDTHLDLLVSALGEGVLCFRNTGRGGFVDFTREAGTKTSFGSTTLALADVDGNGTLDLYVTNYRSSDIKDAGKVDLQMVNGRIAVPRHLQNRLLLVDGQVQEYGEPDILYLNDGKGRFTPVSWIDGSFKDEQGVPLQRAFFDWGLTAAFCDLNNDGAPDLYVCNDYWTPDRIWLNDGSGRFRTMPSPALRHFCASSMGVDFADLNRDGRTDFFVVDMYGSDHIRRLNQAPAYTPPPVRIGEIFDHPQLNRNTLFLGREDGTFAEIAEFSGISGSDWSWQPLFLDVDLDGFQDLLISAGHVQDVQDRDINERLNAQRRPWLRTNEMVIVGGKQVPFQEAFTRQRMEELRQYPSNSSPILAFRNLGNLRFEEKTKDWGLDEQGIHHGIITADLDKDGDLDVVVNNFRSPAGIYRNETVAPKVAVRLKGQPRNSGAIGAKVKLLGGAAAVQMIELTCGGKYLSGSEPGAVFSAGDNAMSIEVRWRTGRITTVQNVLANRIYEIPEPEGVKP
jgi:enediyne biosynthesis protein E4